MNRAALTRACAFRPTHAVIDMGMSAWKVLVMDSVGTTHMIRGQCPDGTIAAALYIDPQTGAKSFDLNAIENSCGDTTNCAIEFKKYLGNPEQLHCGKKLSTESVMVEILDHVKELGRTQLGIDLTKLKIIGPKPVDCSQAASNSIVNAFLRAGLMPLEDGHDGGCLFFESAAVLLLFLVQNGLTDTDCTTLAIDVGKLTTDVHVIGCTGGDLKTLASAGDGDLGGAVIRDVVVDAIFSLAAAKAKVPAIDRSKLEPDERFNIRQKAELAIINLCERPSVTIAVPIGGGRQVPVSITQEMFGQLTAPIVSRIVDCVSKCLAKAGLTPQQVDHIALAGGVCNNRDLQAALSRLFLRPVKTTSNPTMAVAEGALIHGYGILLGRGEIGSIAFPAPPTLTETAPFNIGLIVQRPNGDVVATILFPAGEPIPATTAVCGYLCSPNQTEVWLRVVECDRNNQPVSECRLIGEARISGLPLEKAITERLVIQAVFNMGAVVALTARDLISGKTVTLSCSATPRVDLAVADK